MAERICIEKGGVRYALGMALTRCENLTTAEAQVVHIDGRAVPLGWDSCGAVLREGLRFPCLPNRVK